MSQKHAKQFYAQIHCLPTFCDVTLAPSQIQRSTPHRVTCHEQAALSKLKLAIILPGKSMVCYGYFARN